MVATVSTRELEIKFASGQIVSRSVHRFSFAYTRRSKKNEAQHHCWASWGNSVLETKPATLLLGAST
jgi:hypothetical protein